MVTAVRLRYTDGSVEFVRATHVHGIRNGELLLASGRPGAGFDADVVRRVSIASLTGVETCSESRSDGAPEQSSWTMTWDD